MTDNQVHNLNQRLDAINSEQTRRSEDLRNHLDTKIDELWKSMADDVIRVEARLTKRLEGVEMTLENLTAWKVGALFMMLLSAIGALWSIVREKLH